MTLRHAIFHNFWLKLISLALATIIWFAIDSGIRNDFSLIRPRSNSLAQELLRLPVSIVTQPGDTRAFSISPKDVIVTVVGEDAVLRKLQPQIMKVYIDLTEFQSRNPVAIEAHVHSPPNVTVHKINPTVVTVEQISP
jgi:YbbR domain-containing protein